MSDAQMPIAANAATPRRRRWGVWLGFAAMAALLVLLAVGLTRDPRQLDSVLIGQPWPDRSLPLLELPDHQMGAAQWRGKARMVNLWASWCTSCLQEHPELMRLQKQLTAEGHADQLVGLNYKDKRTDALAWLGRHGNPFHGSLADTDGRLGIDLGVYGAPETFVIDAQGVIRFKHVGVLTEEVINTRVLPLLKEGR
mgnify:CR=1 FL=1|jgi:cytochrome c biogenesis protein CcmG/thiol:disulfide interchange protein DsbE